MDSWRALLGLPRDSWTLAAASFVNRAGTMVVTFLVLYYERRFGLSPDAAGERLLLLGAAGVVASPWAGRLADRYGASRMIRASLCGSGISLLAVPWCDDLGVATTVLVAWTALSELLRPASLVAVTTMTPPHLRRTAYALQRVAVNLGTACGATAGGFVAGRSLDALFWIDGGTSLAAFALLAVVPFRAANVADGGAPGPRTAGPVLPVDVLRDRRLAGVLLALLPCLVAFFQIAGPLTEFVVNDLGRPETLVGLIFAVNTLLIVAVEVPLNARTSRWTHARALSLGALLTGVGFGLYAANSAPAALVAATVVWTVGEMILFPAASDYVAEIAPPARRGAYMGWYSMTFGLAFTAGPFLGLRVLHGAGPAALWLAALGAGVVSAAALLRQTSTRKRS